MNSAGHIAEGMRNQYMDDVRVTRKLIKSYGSELENIGLTEATIKSIHNSKNAGTDKESAI